MSSRVERLERLDELRRIGALTDAEYEQEKSKALNGFSGSSFEITIAPPGIVESSAYDGEELTGLRSHWASSPFGQNKPLALAAVVISTLVIGLMTHSLLVAGVCLAVFSAGAYWLYTGLRIEQKPEHEQGAAPWRVFFYVGCGLILLGFVIPRISGSRSGDDTHSASTQMASVDQAGAGEAGEDDQASEAPSMAATTRMSCKSAMEIAAVATCGIELHKWQAGMGFDATRATNLNGRIAGYQKSLQDARSVIGCQGPVADGEGAAMGSFSDINPQTVSDDIETAKRLCVYNAQEQMEESCRVRELSGGCH